MDKIYTIELEVETHRYSISMITQLVCSGECVSEF